MPEPMTVKIAREFEEYDFSAVIPYISKLQDPKTAESAAKIIYGLLDGYGLRMLIAELDAALLTWQEIYVKRNISEKIFIDTMKNFSLLAHDFHVVNGIYGFDCAMWLWRHLAGLLFRLDTLEFELYTYKTKETEQLKIGTKVLSVHIPSNAVLSREELDKSYSHARAFFRDTEYENVPFFCDSWLLAPKLKEILPESSGILRFQNDFTIIDSSDDDSANLRVFKRYHMSIDELPEDTSLQRKLKQLLAKGETLGEGTGIIPYK